MRRNGRIIKMNPGSPECAYGLFVIHRKSFPFQNQDIENEITKNQETVRTALMRAMRN